MASEGFVKLHTDLEKLRFEFWTQVDAVKLSIKGIEKNLTYNQSEVEDLKEHFEMETKEHFERSGHLKNKKIANLEDRLKQEVENNIALEQYTRRENLYASIILRRKSLALKPPKLDFMRSTELVRRSTAGTDQSLQALSTGKTEIKFAEKEVSLKNLWHTLMHKSHKITPGLSMMKAREEHGLNDAAKVKGRFLIINNERFDSKSIPEYLKQL